MCTNETQHWMENANDLFTVCCGVTSVFLNTLVLYIALRYVDFHVKLNQIYVVNMTVSDLVYGLAYMSTKPLIGCFPAWLCACYYILVWSSQIGSVFFLLFLNIDKFISLSAPLHYHMYVTERRVRWLWISFWVIPLSHSVFTYFGPWLTPNAVVPCKIALQPIYYASTIIVFYIIPLSISAFISVYIYLLAHKKTRWTTPSNDSQAVERKRARKQMLKRVFFVFSSTLLSTITILPYRLAYCIYTFACVSVGSPSAGEAVLANITSAAAYLRASSATEKTTFAAFPFDTSSFVTSPSPLSELTSFGATLINGASDYDNTDQGDKGAASPAMCRSDEISVLIYVLFCLPPLGAVGNPIITIVTQRFYRSRAAKMWTSCMNILHAPAILMCKCCCRKAAGNDGDVTEGTLDSVRRTPSAKENGTGVPLLVTCRQGNRRNDSVAEPEPVCSSRAFQVL